MPQELLTAARVSAMAVTAAGTIAASVFGKKSEKAKQKKLEAERLAIDGPENRIKEKLARSASRYRAARDVENTWLSNTKTEFDDIETRLDRIEKFAEPKLASQEKEVQELFKAAAAKNGPKSRGSQQAPTKTEERSRGIQNPGASFHRSRPRPSRNETTQEMDR